MIVEDVAQLPRGSSSLAVFCDFDGTVAQRDIGYSLFHHFSGGKNDVLLPDWKSRRLSTRECLVREAAMVKASPEQIKTYLDRFGLDSGFPAFVEHCQRRDIPVIVISEGLDLYIEPVLKRNGLEHLPVICNRGEFADESIRISFPFANKQCDWCGSCKGERMSEYRALAGDVRLVYVGDGYSDACAAGAADTLMAKKDLVKYCQASDIPYNSFEDFNDVSEHLFHRDSSVSTPENKRGD